MNPQTDNHPQVATPLALLDFRDRVVCYKSFLYGMTSGAALITPWISPSPELTVILAVPLLIIAKLFHESLPLKSPQVSAAKAMQTSTAPQGKENQP